MDGRGSGRWARRALADGALGLTRTGRRSARTGVSVSSVSSLQGGRHGRHADAARSSTTPTSAKRATSPCGSSAAARRRRSSGARRSTSPRTARPRTASPSSCPSALVAGQLLPRRLHGLGDRRRHAGCATAQDDVLIKGGIPVRGTQAPAALAKASQAAACTRRRPHAGPAGLAAVPGDGQHGLHERPHRRPPQLRRAVEPVPRRHARRPAAERDAVPDRVQPRLRAHEHRHAAATSPGPNMTVAVDHDQRPAGDVHVQAADLPGRPERPGRSRSRRARRVATATRSRRPTRTRPPAPRPAPPRRCRACSARRTSS